MADCELLKGCLFFNDKMPADSGMGTIYKKKYCLGDNTKCARFMVAKSLGREKVPTNLYPNMYDRANELIASG
ncbi:MAG: hypothetical protein RBT69_04390 [Spirochaetia bacterium]|jgi:hypothetical protein|nr:hypothetical protein [Spirochaetia bacterium]